MVLRVLAIVVAWAAVAGGIVLAIIWGAAGGLRAHDPNDELMRQSGVDPGVKNRRVTSFSPIQVGAHGFLGVATASLITYGALLGEGRTGGYFAVFVVALLTAGIGLLLYRKWTSGARPPRPDPSYQRRRPEDRLPRPVVYAHGAAAAATITLAVLLFLLD
jgi:hypothetical protein